MTTATTCDDETSHHSDANVGKWAKNKVSVIWQDDDDNDISLYA